MARSAAAACDSDACACCPAAAAWAAAACWAANAAAAGAKHVTTLPGVHFETQPRLVSWQRTCDELAWRVAQAFLPRHHEIPVWLAATLLGAASPRLRKRSAPEALEGQRLPRAAGDMTRGYYENLRNEAGQNPKK